MTITTTLCVHDFLTQRKVGDEFEKCDDENSDKCPTEDEEDEDDDEDFDGEWELLQNRYPVFITALFFIQYWSFVLDSELGLVSEYADLLVFTSDQWYQPWRYFTVVFIHRNLDHLVGNMMKQLQFGILLEIKYGWRRTCLVYFVGAACGTLFHHVCFSQAGGVSSGASSATKALLFANIPPILANWRNHFKYNGSLLSTLLRILSNSGLVVYSLVGFILELIFFCKTYNKLFYQQQQEADTLPRQYVSHAAHLGGCIGGLLIGILLLSSHCQSHSTSASKGEKSLADSKENIMKSDESSDQVKDFSVDLEQNVIPLITLLSALLATFG